MQHLKMTQVPSFAQRSMKWMNWVTSALVNCTVTMRSPFLRKVGDQKIYVRIKQVAPAQAEIRIRIGVLGNLAESQKLYEHIKDAL